MHVHDLLPYSIDCIAYIIWIVNLYLLLCVSKSSRTAMHGLLASSGRTGAGPARPQEGPRQPHPLAPAKIEALHRTLQNATLLAPRTPAAACAPDPAAVPGALRRLGLDRLIAAKPPRRAPSWPRARTVRRDVALGGDREAVGQASSRRRPLGALRRHLDLVRGALARRVCSRDGPARQSTDRVRLAAQRPRLPGGSRDVRGLRRRSRRLERQAAGSPGWCWSAIAV